MRGSKQDKYNLSDIGIRKIIFFVDDFEIYLKTKYGCGHNTILKFINYFIQLFLLQMISPLLFLLWTEFQLPNKKNRIKPDTVNKAKV